MQAAAKHLTPVTLELGGKSPAIVDETADIKLAARRIAFGKVLNAGQTCVEPDYLLIHRSIKEAFVSEYQDALEQFFPNGDMRDMVNIISEKHYNRVKGLIQGEKIALGGTFDDERRFIAPTLLDDVSPDAPVMQQEIFGPVLPMLCFDTLSEVISFVNSRPKPLAFYIFTADKAAAQRFTACVDSGGQARRAQAAGQLLLRRWLRERYHNSPCLLRAAFRRRRGKRHGQLPRQKKLRYVHARAQHSQ